MRKLWAMMKKEFRQIFRDIRTLSLLVIVPAFILLIFGYALSFDVKNIKTGVLDLDKTEASRELIAALTAGDSFRLVRYWHNSNEIDRSLDSGSVSLAFVIPEGFGRNIYAGRPSDIQILIDGSNSQAASIIRGYANAFIQTHSQKIVSDRFLSYARFETAPPVAAEPRIWYNPELKSSLFLIPGLIVLILMISSTISTALSVVREKERGTIEQLLVSPLSPAQIIMGKTIPYIFISLAGAFVILVTGWAFFGLEIKGSYAALLLAFTLFILAALAQGVLISTITNSQQVAFFAASLSSILPSLLLSGFIFPIKSMPYALQLITYAVSARYFVQTLWAIMLKGAGIEAYWEDLAMLALFAFVTLAAATIRMRRTKIA